MTPDERLLARSINRGLFCLRRRRKQLLNPFPRTISKGSRMNTPYILANTDEVEFDLDLIYADGGKTVDDASATATSSDTTLFDVEIDGGKLKVISVDGAVGTATATVTDGSVTFTQDFQIMNPVPTGGDVDLTSAVVTKKATANPAPQAASTGTTAAAAAS